jgi:hypothetical protein
MNKLILATAILITVSWFGAQAAAGADAAPTEKDITPGLNARWKSNATTGALTTVEIKSIKIGVETRKWTVSDGGGSSSDHDVWQAKVEFVSHTSIQSRNRPRTSSKEDVATFNVFKNTAGEWVVSQIPNATPPIPEGPATKK